MHGNEFAGRLDFNQYTREYYCSEILLEVQSPLKQGDKRLFCPGALNSNQYTREINVFDALLEVQSPVRYKDTRIIYLGALNSKTACFRTRSETSDTDYSTLSEIFRLLWSLLFFCCYPAGFPTS